MIMTVLQLYLSIRHARYRFDKLLHGRWSLSFFFRQARNACHKIKK